MPPPTVCKFSKDGLCRVALPLLRTGMVDCTGESDDRDNCPRWSGKG